MKNGNKTFKLICFRFLGQKKLKKLELEFYKFNIKNQISEMQNMLKYTGESIIPGYQQKVSDL